MVRILLFLDQLKEETRMFLKMDLNFLNCIFYRRKLDFLPAVVYM